MLGETFRAVWESFRANRLRFVLTLLGLVVGSSSLVLLSGLLEGGQEALLSSSQKATEKDLVEVRSASPPRKQRGRTTRDLNSADAEALDTSPLLGDAQVVGQRMTTEQVRWKAETKTVTFVGCGPEAQEIYRLSTVRGRFLDESDGTERRRLAVIGHRVWTELFDSAEDLRGLELQTRGERFLVIGVLARKPALGGEGPWMWDNRVLVPQSTFDLVLPSSLSGRRNLDRIFVRLSGLGHLADRIAQVRGITRATLLRRHYGVDNFRIRGERESDGEGDLIIGIISMLILATAAVSLVVGGINVMNIMLVSVTERTREIGIRRACGAPRSAVLWQFLAESAATAGLGGAIGVALGIGLTASGAAILRRVLGEWTFHIVWWAPPLALGSALLVGVAFGLYPAWRAAKLDPVEALRFD
jgi:putative ABC transport system permease protein